MLVILHPSSQLHLQIHVGSAAPNYALFGHDASTLTNTRANH